MKRQRYEISFGRARARDNGLKSSIRRTTFHSTFSTAELSRALIVVLVIGTRTGALAGANLL